MRLDPIQTTERKFKYVVKVEHILAHSQVFHEPEKEFDKKEDALNYIKQLHAMYKQAKEDDSKPRGGVHPVKIAQVTNIYLYREQYIKDVYIAIDGEYYD